MDVQFRVRRARSIAAEIERYASSEKLWEVAEGAPGQMTLRQIDPIAKALRLLSQIDLEAYLVDENTRILIDKSLLNLYPRFYKEERGSPE